MPVWDDIDMTVAYMRMWHESIKQWMIDARSCFKRARLLTSLRTCAHPPCLSVSHSHTNKNYPTMFQEIFSIYEQYLNFKILVSNCWIHPWCASELEVRRDFFAERVINVWNCLPPSIDYSTLAAFRRSIDVVDFTYFLKCDTDWMFICC